MDAATVTAAAGGATCLRRGLVGRSSSRSVRPPAMVSFADEGHLHYYASARCALKGESKKKEEKKREKLMKGLRKDLLEFSSMRLGGETQGTVTAEVKSKMISEAADVLLSQLAQLRAEAKETKRRKKEEKKAAMKLAKAKDDNSGSSSSSSESSDSECESTAVVRTSSTGRTTVPEGHGEAPKPLAMEVGEDKERKNATLETNADEAAKAKAMSNKIEVCMGGKCKKSGATELLAEFDRAVGVEGAVVGCKCMGKCRDGPNVRVVVNHRSVGGGEEAKKVSRNPLCIGVSLGDVGAVVSNFFGEESKDVGFLAA
ncbi:diacylglycerol O-acyltransferase 3, cytosolic [Iris pallida]|uniref:Diacylglycerol O-acyltransferase 3, cytosolic n=1 Tax=Iris pallida TaxID=29817 RepID=A0AAX6F1A3_IRIPA|nr:diacylglycerol O-acyltransferase 3, cytosolic [Iris pallida]